MKKSKEMPLELPREYRIPLLPFVPESIDFLIPGFEKNYPIGYSKCLALRKRDCAQWYHEFVDSVIAACGRQFMPVCRLSDGEFFFLLGEQPTDIRLGLFQRIKQKLIGFREHISLKGGVAPFTAGHYHSGEYNAEEVREARREYPQKIRELSEKGILALHLNYVRDPFHERFFPSLGRWLKENEIILNDNNYYPFYFVYALLTGLRRGELLKNRNVLVVNGAQGEKRQQIEKGLEREGVSKVFWCPISSRRSLYASVDMNPDIGKVDLALVGAGLGKANILLQMEPLNVPCIDAGYVFEIWYNPKNKFDRVWCATDEEWNLIGSDPIRAGIAKE